MADAFNPYHEWLGLAADVASPNYYQLLGLAEREADLERIAIAGDRALARVRSFRPGVHAKLWSELLDEIFAAKSSLLDPDAKADYDRRLTDTSLAAPLDRDEKRPESGGPVKAPVDIDRYPPGMAPPGARPQTSFTPQLEPGSIAAELVSDVPPGGYHPPLAVEAEVIAATAVPEWGGASSPAGYPQPAYPAPTAGYAPGMYGLPAAAPMANPYGPHAVPYGVVPPASQSPVAHYGSPGAAPIDPMAPVSIPGIGGGALASSAPQRIVGFAGAAAPHAQAAKAYAPQAAVPMGTAVAPQASPQMTPAASSGVSVNSELAHRRNEQKWWNLMLAGVMGGAVALAALIIYINLPPSAPAEAPAIAQTSPPPETPQPMPRAVESTLPMGKPTPIPSVRPMPVQPAPAPMATPLPAVDPSPAPVVPQSTPLAPPMPQTTSETKPEPMPVTPPAPPPTPAPTPMSSAAELAALSKALTLGRAALGEQNFDEADKYIAEAQSLARLPEHQAMASRLKEVAGYVRQFRKAVELAAQNFEAAESFTVGTSTRVAVVEVLPDKIILRHTGQNKTYPYADLPPGLAVAIADFKLDGADPMSRVVKGAFYAVSKGDQVALRQKAKTWWEEAQLGGVDLTHLMPFLTESYDLAASP